MLPEMVAASFACFSVLAFFARRNYRTGWVKPRISLEEMLEVEMNWKRYPAPIRSVVTQGIPKSTPSPIVPSLRDVTNFTQQLAQFHHALKAETATPAAEHTLHRVPVT